MSDQPAPIVPPPPSAIDRTFADFLLRPKPRTKVRLMPACGLCGRRHSFTYQCRREP